ncbi:Na+/H+ antiporter subunit E [Devosia yakushimensis]|uniref:Na+/H+ antiporter subunit E n=1 Tax=Devosia yakushimensis TaxID=470028 RepID=A0ABQ5UJ05_9HYPH|nr:Na+/H+ antiporter subunit E [Devosia yakushimensis]GLQ11155.1 Na+/H+ antiporter subunit E [Devosia yakushimensis]
MKRILPYPLLFVGLLLMWLLLQQSLGLGHILLGGLIALGASHAMAALQPEQPTIRRPFKIARLIVLVLVDVARSNLAVARIILAGRQPSHKPGFLLLPLDLKDKSGLAVLSCIVTATPGSAWLEYDPVDSTVLIHVLDLVDEQEWIDTIKHRYEARLLEIFQ